MRVVNIADLKNNLSRSGIVRFRRLDAKRLHQIWQRKSPQPGQIGQLLQTLDIVALDVFRQRQ